MWSAGLLVDVDAAVGEDAGVAVYPADGGAGGDDAFQAFRCGNSGHDGLLPRNLGTFGYSAAVKWLSRLNGRISEVVCDKGGMRLLCSAIGAVGIEADGGFFAGEQLCHDVGGGWCEEDSVAVVAGCDELIWAMRDGTE